MAIRDKRITNSNGISYTKEVDGISDHTLVPINTYFKDLSDGLIYWKNGSNVVIGIYELGDGGDGGGSGITGSTGRVDYVARWTPNDNELGYGSIQDNGSNVRIAPTFAGAPQTRHLVEIRTFNTQADVALYVANTNSGLTSGTGQGFECFSQGANDLNIGSSIYSLSGADSNIGGYFNIGSNTLPTNIDGYAANFDWGIFTLVDNIIPGRTSVGIRSKVRESPIENIAIHGVAGPSFINPGSNHYAAQFEDGTEAAGKVLTSMTSDGKANWAHPSIVTTSSASFNVTSEHTILGNTTGNITINLPAAASNSGKIIVIKKINAANTLTVDGNASETIDGATTFPMTTLNESVTVQCDGSNWFIIGKYL